MADHYPRVILDPEGAEAVFQLADAARRAGEAGAVAPERAAAWRDGVARAGAKGVLLVAMTAFMASGRRP